MISLFASSPSIFPLTHIPIALSLWLMLQGCCEEQYVDPSFLETLLTEYSNITCILRHSGFGFLPSNATFLQWLIGRECHQTCSRKEEMFGWKFWHYFPRNRRDVHEIQLEVQSCKPSRMQDLRMKCLWFWCKLSWSHATRIGMGGTSNDFGRGLLRRNDAMHLSMHPSMCLVFCHLKKLTWHHLHVCQVLCLFSCLLQVPWL